MFDSLVLKLFICFVSLYLIQSCGVKGKPQSPLKNPYIGEGINATPTVIKNSNNKVNSGQKK
jgi:hypothetical protein